MASSIASAAKERQRERDGRAASGRLRTPSASSTRSPPHSAQALPDLRLPASLGGAGGEVDEARGLSGPTAEAAERGGESMPDDEGDHQEVKKGWLAYFLGDDDGEEEEELAGDEADGEEGAGPDRPRWANTALILSVSVPRAGFIFKCGSAASALQSHQAAGRDRGPGAMLDVAATGVTLLYRQLKLEDPGAAFGGAAPSGAAGHVEGQRERERERQVRGRVGHRCQNAPTQAGRRVSLLFLFWARCEKGLFLTAVVGGWQVIRDVRACLVGLCAHVHPHSSGAETFLAVGGRAASLCTKSRVDVLARGQHSAGAVLDARAEAQGGGGTGQGAGIWAGMPQPRSFAGALSLFEQARMVRKNSKEGWLWRGDSSHNEPMSEGEVSAAIQAVFSSPLPGARRCGEEVDQPGGGGGMLMEALMGRDGNTVAASLLRRAQGEEVPLAVAQPEFNDGW